MTARDHMRPQRPSDTGHQGAHAPGSDEQIWEDVHEHLMNDPNLDATEVEIVVEDAEVTLTGRVDSRESKWLAEEIARGVAGVRDVHNRLKIARL
jgi:osmotically-inducible protein OsmY